MSQTKQHSRREILPEQAQPSISTRPKAERVPVDAALVTGTLIGFTDRGEPLVLFPGSPLRSSVVGRSCVYLERGFVGRTVLLHLEDRDPCRPLIVGTVIPMPLRTAPARSPDVEAQGVDDAELAGERVVLRAGRELVLECGEASMTLASNGRVCIRGTKVVSRASGVNAIRGGSVEIN